MTVIRWLAALSNARQRITSRTYFGSNTNRLTASRYKHHRGIYAHFAPRSVLSASGTQKHTSVAYACFQSNVCRVLLAHIIPRRPNMCFHLGSVPARPNYHPHPLHHRALRRGQIRPDAEPIHATRPNAVELTAISSFGDDGLSYVITSSS